MKIWIVEHREYKNAKFANMDNVVMCVLSTKRKAINWCKRNRDCYLTDSKYPWNFAIYSETIDKENDCGNVILLAPDGQEIKDLVLFLVEWKG